MAWIDNYKAKVFGRKHNIHLAHAKKILKRECFSEVQINKDNEAEAANYIFDQGYHAKQFVMAGRGRFWLPDDEIATAVKMFFA